MSDNVRTIKIMSDEDKKANERLDEVDRIALVVTLTVFDGRFDDRFNAIDFEKLGLAEIIVHHPPSGELRKQGIYLTKMGRLFAAECERSFVVSHELASAESDSMDSYGNGVGE